MAKTIKEMARDAYLQGLYINPHDWKEGYISGANAVLGEFEKIIYDEALLIPGKIHRVKELIERLRGE